MEDCEYGLRAMSHAWNNVGGGVQETGNGVGMELSGIEEVVGAVPGLWSGGRGRIAAGEP